MKNNRKDYNWTNNRTYYNKLRKYYLEVDGEICCSYCKYNRNENNKGKWYGGYNKKIKIPNWKLISRNKKQWMGKPKNYKIIPISWVGNYVYYEIKW